MQRRPSAGAVLFDLDDTLTDRALTVRAYAKYFERDFGAALTELRWRAAPALDELEQHWRDLVPSLTQARAGATQVIQNAKQRGFHVGVVTNGPDGVQRLKLRLLGAWEIIDSFTTSEAVGVKKPARQIFERARQAANVAAEACVFVGDHLEKDVEGAAAFGMRGVWIRTAANRAVESTGVFPEIDNLDELLQLL